MQHWEEIRYKEVSVMLNYISDIWNLMMYEESKFPVGCS